MAYISTLADQADYVHVLRQGNAYLVLETIGCDDEVEDATYVLMVTIDPTAGGDLELAFNISKSVPGHPDDVYWDGLQTEPFLTGEDRAAVLLALLNIVKNLVRVVNPSKVFMCTMQPGLPDKALAKYLEICRVCEEDGFNVTEQEAYQGRRMWVIEKPE
jgi:hypothetical protein